MSDVVIPWGKSLLQHGSFNDRVYLMKLAEEDFPGIIDYIETLCQENGYSKVFAVIPQPFFPQFKLKGYAMEAFVPGYFQGKVDAFFIGKFFSSKRALLPANEMEIFQQVLLSNGCARPQSKDFSLRQLVPGDVKGITGIYKTVFERYPFPIHDEAYILKTMESNVDYFGVFDGDTLAAVSSAEMDFTYKNSEMTDFAVLPEYRGQGLGQTLLSFMEREIPAHGILTAYTIARLNSPGMNKTFLKGGYKYSGTLVNNTCISSGIESMNVWYKPLSN